MDRISLFQKRKAIGNSKLKSLVSRKKEGSSLVSVVIGVLFLAAVGFTILMVATRYLVTVHVDSNSSDNFYQTEGILEEVRTGLLEYAGDSSEVAYNDIMVNYTKATESMKETFAKEYICGIAESITGITPYNWQDSEIGKIQPCDIKKLQALTKKPDAVKTMPGTSLGFVINYSDTKGYSLTIKNLLIDYTDESNYRSTIQADINIRVPDYKFEGDSTLGELKDYIVICDDMLQVSNGSTSAGVTFTGNIYTGNRDTGIRVDTQNGADFKSQTIISRGNMDVYTGAKVDVSGEPGTDGSAVPGDLWLLGLRMRSQSGVDSGSSLSTEFTMNENAYIENDLDIGDDNSVVTISGKYYGYSYNEENTASGEARADYSSAILINGLNTILDTDALDKLILAGRTFVSRYDDQPSDIMMGESLAVKSNQIAYLLPNEYISTGSNPSLTSDNPTVNVTALRNSDIGPYLPNGSEPYMANYNSNGYVYFYLKFKDEKNANEYFRQYYAGTGKDEDGNEISNKTQLTERARAYISTSDTDGMKLSPNLYLIAGNIIHNYYATDGSSIQTENYYDNAGNPKDDLLDDGRKIGQDYVGRQLTLLASGGTGSMRLAADAKGLVDSQIIDFSKIPSGGIDTEDNAPGGRIYVTKGDYTVDGSWVDGDGIQRGLIIAEGDVDVQHDFTGLIIAGGKVTTKSGNLQLESDIVMVGNLLEYAREDEELSKVFRGMNGTETHNPTDLSQCISYQNWVKNDISN
ncbi:MAG: hypothetical protein J1F02_07185 [Lachnospiraceae bacterium]|nr:hypothetical protein [Lachnospiraceae bacterium]